MKNPFKTPNNQNSIITGIDMMGDNIRGKLRFCGEDVVLYPLCKMIKFVIAPTQHNEATLLPVSDYAKKRVQR